MKPHSYSRAQLVYEASLTKQDAEALAQCRGDYNRLGFAYQLGFVRLHNRFPTQQPLEINEELLGFTAMQLGIDGGSINDYGARQPTVSDHQARIRDYLGLSNFGLVEMKALEQFIFEEACRLEQTSALLSRALQFLKERNVLFPADYALQRIVSEQRKLARDHIFKKVIAALPEEVPRRLDEMLEVKANQTVSVLQKIKTNPGRPSAEAMHALIEKLGQIVKGGEKLWIDSGLSFHSAGAYQEAIDAYTEALNSEGHVLYAYVNRGLCYIQLDQNQQALSDIEEAMRLSPDFESGHFLRGYARMLSGNFQEALHDFDAELESNPDHDDVNLYRGITYQELNEYEMAVSDFTKKIAVDSESAEAYRRRAIVYTLLGKTEEAQRDIVSTVRLGEDAEEIAEAIDQAKLSNSKIES